MPKRSLIEQLNDAVDMWIRQPDAEIPGLDASLVPLRSIAADLCQLPRPEFKARLKSDLQRRSSMTTTATEPPSTTHTIASPRISFKDAAKAIAFYQTAFGAKETMRFETGGGIAHAEIMIGDSLIMLAEEWPEGGRYSAETLGQSPISMELNVPDVDAFVERAIAAGARILRPVAEQFYGYRAGTLLDPFGYSWTVFTKKQEMSVQEMHRALQQEEAAKPAVAPVPKGYLTVTPYLVAVDGPALLEFVKQAFGAEETFRTVGSAGGLHSEARLGDSMLMIGGGIPGREFRSTPNTHALHFYVKDTDAAYQKALAAGATSISAPADQEYGERSAGVKDPAGNYWYIATHLGKTYMPEGLNTINAYLHPLRAEPVIRFLKQAFGAREIAKYAQPDGVVMHAEIRVGTSMVEMGESHGPYQPMSGMFYLYVPDCDAVYRRALAAGATSISEPQDQSYGDRSGGVKDAFGNQWYIATHIKDVEG